MELVNIEKLLEKYDNAATTLQEEKTLQAYFMQGNVPEHLEGYKQLFNYFTENKNEKSTKSFQLKTKKQRWKWLGLVASFILIFSAYTNHQKQEQLKAEKIYAQTHEALQLLASNLNKGNAAILQLATFEQTTNKVFKQKK